MKQPEQPENAMKPQRSLIKRVAIELRDLLVVIACLVAMLAILKVPSGIEWWRTALAGLLLSIIKKLL